MSALHDRDIELHPRLIDVLLYVVAIVVVLVLAFYPLLVAWDVIHANKARPVFGWKQWLLSGAALAGLVDLARYKRMKFSGEAVEIGSYWFPRIKRRLAWNEIRGYEVRGSRRLILRLANDRSIEVSPRLKGFQALSEALAGRFGRT